MRPRVDPSVRTQAARPLPQLPPQIAGRRTADGLAGSQGTLRGQDLEDAGAETRIHFLEDLEWQVLQTDPVGFRQAHQAPDGLVGVAEENAIPREQRGARSRYH